MQGGLTTIVLVFRARWWLLSGGGTYFSVRPQFLTPLLKSNIAPLTRLASAGSRTISPRAAQNSPCTSGTVVDSPSCVYGTSPTVQAVAEGTEFVREAIRDDGPDADFDAVESLKQEQPQNALKFIQIHNLIESCSGSEIIRAWNAKGDEIGAQPVITDSLEPLDCSGCVATIEASACQQGQLLLV